jgi:hypothetical protein
MELELFSLGEKAVAPLMPGIILKSPGIAPLA